MDDPEARGERWPAHTAPAPPSDAPAAPPGNHRSRWLALALLVLLALGATVIILTRRPHDTAIRPVPRDSTLVAPADTDKPFPSETASDVVSYADHVALVTAVSEGEAPSESAPPHGTFPPGETAAWRHLTFRVDGTLWSRADAPAAPKQLTALWHGWLVKGDSRRLYAAHGAPVIFMGAQYVMPIAYTGSAFTAIQPFATFPFRKGALAKETSDTPLARLLDHASRDEVADVFANAVPDPLAAQYRHLLPRARLAAVLAARSP